MKDSLRQKTFSASPDIITVTRARRIATLVRYGLHKPRRHQLFEIDPQTLVSRYATHKYAGLKSGARHSGMVLDGTWDRAHIPSNSSIRYSACKKRFIDGITWENTGIYDYFLRLIAQGEIVDDCKNRADIVARYARLDELWDIVQRTGQLPTSLTHVEKARDGILIHIDRDGRPMFANQGFHRLAIAQLAKVPTVGVVLGLTHHEAVVNKRYRAFLDAYGVNRSP